jgi:glycosyltransferase involved in cell wall biosynthesis
MPGRRRRIADPRVSTIVTTRARPELVTRAVASALAQSLRDIEVIVVVDGPDPDTVAALQSVADERLRIHVREMQGGQPAAINDGVRLARSPWTALLDDDDEWMPEKLERQLRSAEASASSSPIVGCRFVARNDSGDVLWPLRSPARDERISEYLFRRRKWAFGEGVLPTSVFFAPTELFRRVPMAEELHHHCDLDWLIRVDQLAGVKLEMPTDPAPLAIWQNQRQRRRLSSAPDWRFSYQWIVRSRANVTPRAYAGFLLTWVSSSARLRGDKSAILTLLGEAFRHGRPEAMSLAVYAAVWCLPLDTRNRLSRLIARSEETGSPS